MAKLSDHYIRVRDYARGFSLDESTVYKMIDWGEIEAARERRDRTRGTCPAHGHHSPARRCRLVVELKDDELALGMLD